MLGLGSSLALGGAPSEWTILETSPELWLKFNTGQTTPDIDDDGDTDILWADQSGNGNDCTGGNSVSGILDTKQGSFVSGNWVPGDNADFLNCSEEITLTNGYTIFMVFTYAGNKDTFIGGSSTSDFMRFAQGGNVNKFRSKHGGVTNDIIFDINPTTGTCMWKISRNADGDELTITQNTTTLIMDAATVSTNPFDVDRVPAGSYGLVGGIVGEVVVYDRVVTDAESALIEADILERNSLTAD